MTEQKRELDAGELHYHENLKAGLKSLDDAALAINGTLATRIRRVPEPYFVAMLLPILQKWIINNPEDPPEPGLWFNVADGLNNEIVIIDAEGKDVMTVPPLFVKIPDRNPLEGHRLASVHQMVAIQGQMFDNSDHRAAHTMESQLVQLLEPRPEDDAKTRALLQLIEVYRRYNLPLVDILGRMAADVETELNKRDKVTTKASAITADPSAGINADEEYIF